MPSINIRPPSCPEWGIEKKGLGSFHHHPNCVRRSLPAPTSSAKWYWYTVEEDHAYAKTRNEKRTSRWTTPKEEIRRMGGYIKQETASHTHRQTLALALTRPRKTSHRNSWAIQPHPSPSPPPMKRETSGIILPTAPSRPTCPLASMHPPRIQGGRKGQATPMRSSKREEQASFTPGLQQNAGSPEPLPRGSARPGHSRNTTNPGVSTTTPTQPPPSPPQ